LSNNPTLKRGVIARKNFGLRPQPNLTALRYRASLLLLFYTKPITADLSACHSEEAVSDEAVDRAKNDIFNQVKEAYQLFL